MEHPDWPAFLAAIVENPDDDTARLVAADFLEENGEPDRAAFVRVQVELARLEAAGQGKSLEADELRKRERAFLGPLSMDRQFWAAEACPELVRVVTRSGGRDPLEAMTVEGADRLTWRRGFVEGVTCPAEEWLRRGAAVRQRNPIRTVGLSDCLDWDRGRWWAILPLLRGLRLVGVVELAPTSAMADLLAWLRAQLPEVRLIVAADTASGDVRWLPRVDDQH